MSCALETRYSVLTTGIHEGVFAHSRLQIIKPTTFETLETLADHTAKLLQEEFLATRFPQGCILRLAISKPRAIPFADAPAVEVVRNNHENLARCVSRESEPAISVRDLNVVKPYA